jgi:hypothetical protein
MNLIHVTVRHHLFLHIRTAATRHLRVSLSIACHGEGWASCGVAAGISV